MENYPTCPICGAQAQTFYRDSLGQIFGCDECVKAGYLAGDGWAQISGFDDTFAVDASNPRVEVEIEEIDETE